MTVRFVEGLAMRHFRFHIGSLLILVVLLGVGFAALREANDLWDGIVLSSALGVLLMSVLLVVHRRAERRAFWIGFAMFGWAYLGLIAIPSIEPRLLTTKALAFLDTNVPGRPAVTTGFTFSPPATLTVSSTSRPRVQLWSARTGRPLWSRGGTTENFVHIGHSLFALILAWLGGKLSRHLHGRALSRLAGPAHHRGVEVGAEGGESDAG